VGCEKVGVEIYRRRETGYCSVAERRKEKGRNLLGPQARRRSDGKEKRSIRDRRYSKLFAKADLKKRAIRDLGEGEWAGGAKAYGNREKREAGMLSLDEGSEEVSWVCRCYRGALGKGN